MEKNLLLSKMQEIQLKYKELLSRIIYDFDGPCRCSALDEVICFWIKYKPLVNMFLENYVSNQDVFVMTAVTYLDVEEGEQFPFFLLGSTHILDDPLGKYCEICNNIASKQNIPLEAEISKCAKDNLKVLTKYPQIIVIPLRLFNESEKQEILNAGCEQLFLSMFSNISSIGEYWEKIVSIDDIKSGINGYERYLLLDDKDDPSLPFEERFENVRDLMNNWFPGNLTDGGRFFLLIYSYLFQALDIILSCAEYSIIPYIRYGLALQYYFLCSDVLEREGKINCKKKNVILANVVYKIADVNRLRSRGDDRFFEIVKEVGFWENIKKETNELVVEQGIINRIEEIVERNLQRLYAAIEVEK